MGNYWLNCICKEQKDRKIAEVIFEPFGKQKIYWNPDIPASYWTQNNWLDVEGVNQKDLLDWVDFLDGSCCQGVTIKYIDKEIFLPNVSIISLENGKTVRFVCNDTKE